MNSRFFHFVATIFNMRLFWTYTLACHSGKDCLWRTGIGCEPTLSTLGWILMTTRKSQNNPKRYTFYRKLTSSTANRFFWLRSAKKSSRTLLLEKKRCKTALGTCICISCFTASPPGFSSDSLDGVFSELLDEWEELEEEDISSSSGFWGSVFCGTSWPSNRSILY